MRPPRVGPSVGQTEAARQFNARGISGTALDQVAQRVGLTRAALYYYFEDSEDLAFRCYLRACEVAAEDLARADEDGASALEKLDAYVRRSLDRSRPPIAALTEIPYLTKPHQVVIHAAHTRNVLALRRFLELGVEEGDLRRHDSEVVAHTIVGIVTYVPVSAAWIGAEDDAAFRERSAKAIADLLGRGVASDRGVEVRCPISASDFEAEPPRTFDRSANAAYKVEQLLQTASLLFNRRGIDGASLDDITAAVGATKGAEYHYLQDKTDLVVRCYERAFDLYERFVDAADRLGKTGLERLVIGTHLNCEAQASRLAPLMPLTGIESLPAATRRGVVRRARQLYERFEDFGFQGIEDGSLRPYDVESLALAGAGAFGWIPKWLPADDARAPSEIAREILALLTRGLASLPASPAS